MSPVAQAYRCHLRGAWIYVAVGAAGGPSRGPGPAPSLDRDKHDSSLPDTLDSNPGLPEGQAFSSVWQGPREPQPSVSA